MIEEYMAYYNNERLQRNLGAQTLWKNTKCICGQRKTASGFNSLAEIFIFLIVYLTGSSSSATALYFIYNSDIEYVNLYLLALFL